MVKKELDQNHFPFDGIMWIDETDEEFIGRCPFCGDSKRSKNKGHLYISKKQPIFICHRCSHSGNIYLLEEFLNEKCKLVYDNSQTYEIGNYDIKSILTNVNDRIISNNEITDSELNYFYSRCDNDKLSIDELKKLFRLISIDSIIKRFPDTDRQFIYNRTWFMSALGNIYVGRAWDNDNFLRYMKLSDNDSNTIVDSYLVYNYEKIKNPDTLIIAEGIFDIIPLYFNCRKYGLSKNSIFSACLGSFYNRSEKTFQNIFLSKPKNIEIFADKGISLTKLKSQFSSKLKFQNITVHYPLVKDWNETGPIDMSFKI